MSDNPSAPLIGQGNDEQTTVIARAFASLEKLEKLCCDPGRSPQMQQIRDTLEDVRSAVEASLGIADLPAVLVRMEDAGSQLGQLQVTCCTPKRNHLYAGMLEDLNTLRLDAGNRVGIGHRR